MFGYVILLKGEMKVKDFVRFKCYYCGLCCYIKKEFGNILRVFLNYDMIFLGLLLDVLNFDEFEVIFYRCIIYFIEKKIIIYNNRVLFYVVFINIFLFYYKLVDDVNDDKDFKSKFGIIFLLLYKKKFFKFILNINISIKYYLNEFYILENNKFFNFIDEICDLFSKLVGIIFKDYFYELNDDFDNLCDILYLLGYFLGKWIYLIDVLDDLKFDMEKEKFNLINFLYNKKNLLYDKFVKYIKFKLEFIILNCGYNCKENLKKLDFKKNKDILYNIIEFGLMDKYVKIIDSIKNINEI